MVRWSKVPSRLIWLLWSKVPVCLPQPQDLWNETQAGNDHLCAYCSANTIFGSLWSVSRPNTTSVTTAAIGSVWSVQSCVCASHTCIPSCIDSANNTWCQRRKPANSVPATFIQYLKACKLVCVCVCVCVQTCVCFFSTYILTILVIALRQATVDTRAHPHTGPTRAHAALVVQNHCTARAWVIWRRTDRCGDCKHQDITLQSLGFKERGLTQAVFTVAKASLLCAVSCFIKEAVHCFCEWHECLGAGYLQSLHFRRRGDSNAFECLLFFERVLVEWGRW